MAQATAATIKTQLEAGTYPEGTLTSNNIFDYEQYGSRRRYPSCEVITTQPESSVETKKDTTLTTGYEIRVFTKNLGIRTDEVATQKSVEDVIMAQMESMVLQDHKITFESKTWSRSQVQRDGAHPAYTVSSLKIVVRQITTTTASVDGTLKFVAAGSSVDGSPSDYTYSNVFDVDLQGGYRTIEEGHTGSNIPMRFAGHIQGRFIASIMVKAADLGSGADKLTTMPKLRTNGEKGIYQFEYTNKTSDSSTITNTFDCEIESVQMQYRVTEGVVFRLIARLISDITVTIV